MTDTFLIGAFSAFWLGVLTSISPCPLATNIAAISYIGRDLANPRKALLSGIGYTFGRSLIYVLLSAILVASLLAMPVLAQALQRDLNKILGPLMVVVGIVLLDLFSIRIPGADRFSKLAQCVPGGGWWTSALIGALFAISFCPVSAALFFGSLLPLAARHESAILFPVLYGFGTGLPVMATGLVVVYASRGIGVWFAKLAAVERFVRRLAAVLFIAVGIYYILLYWLELQVL